MNPKILYSIYISLNIIIIIDIILILYEIIFNVSPNIAYNIHVFDLIVCTILLTEFSIKFYISKSKKIFIKNNWLDLIAFGCDFYVPRNMLRLQDRLLIEIGRASCRERV